MGFNEMYTDPGGRVLTPFEEADYWVLYVQPAAFAAGLELVSPKSGAKLTARRRASNSTSSIVCRIFEILL